MGRFCLLLVIAALPPSLVAQVEAPAADAAVDASPAEPPPTMEDRPWPLRTYDVRVDVVAAPGMLRPGDLRRIDERLRAGLGPACKVTTTVRPIAALPNDTPPLAKRLLIQIAEDGATVQEHDLWADAIGPAATVAIPHRELLATIVADRAVAAFRPRVLIETEDDGLSGQPWGRAIDPDLVRPGDLGTPLLRFTDREGAFRETRPVAWTLVRVVSQTDLEYRLDTISGFRQPIPPRIRRGEAVVLIESPLFASTTLRLQTGGQATAGLAVTATPADDDFTKSQQTEEAEANPQPVFTDRSDRFGVVRIDTADRPDCVWVDVKSRDVLARVPIGLGLRPEVVVPLVDDSISIALAERLDAIRADLTDTFASRVVLMARIRSAGKEKQWALVDEALEQIKTLPTIDDYLGRLNAARVEATIAAGDDRRQAARARLEAERLARTVRESLDEKPVVDLKTEMDELRRLSTNEL